MQRLVTACLLALGLGLTVPIAPARAEVTAEQVRQAIDRGVFFLKNEQRKDGSWPEHPTLQGGVTALATLALLNCGVPTTDETVDSALNYLLKVPPKFNYVVCLQTMVFAQADPTKYGMRILQNVSWLEKQQKRGNTAEKFVGSWGYPEGYGDNSNSQFAVLALYEAQRAGIPVSLQTWELAKQYWLRGQRLDGSWAYRMNDPGSGTGSMTCAGIGAMVMAQEMLDEGDARVLDGRVQCCQPHDTNDSVELGLKWLGRKFSVAVNPGDDGRTFLLYYLYGLERTGRLTNQRFIGMHDWYREGAEHLINEQEDLRGQWKGTGLGEATPDIGTSLALLFLAKGRRPVVAAKLRHGPGDDWNHHRKDLANLVTYTERKWARDLTWQVIDIDAAKADDLLEAPILYLCGEQAPEISEEDVAKLREYVNRGGFIFADAVCDGQDFDRGFRRLMDRTFPEPEHALHLLPPDHAVWSTEEPVNPRYVRPLWGIDVGCRTSVIYCPDNLSCYWELARPGRESVNEKKYPTEIQGRMNAARAIGVNVLAYATNREPKYKLDLPQLAATGAPDSVGRAKLYVATVKHSGGWNAAPMALPNLLRYLSGEMGLRTNTDAREVSLNEDRLFEFPVVFIHGRNAFHFSDAERKRLRTYLDRGGVLFADAICSSEEFANSFRKEIAEIFPEHPLARLPVSDELFSDKYGGFDLKSLARREPQRQGAGAPLKSTIRQVEPELETVKLGDRYAVIFSRYDLSCALERHESLECAGYTRDDAARLGLNVLLYAMHE